MREKEIAKWSGILVYLECYKGHIHKAGIELIGEAYRLSRQTREEVYVLGIGEDMKRIQEELTGYPIECAYLYETEDEYTPLWYEEIAAECIRRLKPAIVLIGGTLEGRSLAPRLAVAFRTGLTADCTALSIAEDGGLIQTRHAFGGNVMASIVTPERRPQFATVRPGVVEAIEKNNLKDTAYIRKTVQNKNIDIIRVLKSIPVEAQEDITKQKVLVVAGRGVKKKEDLAMLRELAGLVGGNMASSRALVEKGWTKAAEQIGLSGNTVSPEYMITCGVSGTVQFMAGMRNTKNIIAINTDANARIFDIAHYPVCADLYDIVPELIQRLKKGRSEIAEA